jgi:hypothetical protein
MTHWYYNETSGEPADNRLEREEYIREDHGGRHREGVAQCGEHCA